MIMVPASGIAYVVLMAISEEQFFRGFILDLLLSKFTRKIVAVILAGLIFVTYHIAMYGTDADAMLYVLAGGVILSWVAYRSRRLSPGMIAHIFNNVRAVIGM
jgi:membrane protease YdiL (CAAX protease family)